MLLTTVVLGIGIVNSNNSQILIFDFSLQNRIELAELTIWNVADME